MSTPIHRCLRRLAATVTLLVLLPAAVRAGEVTVAVATNFALPMEALATRFEAETGHELTVVLGSTGKLYAQIRNGAPFDVLLAADQARPQRLERETLAEPGTRFTYALGRLVLWSADPALIGADCRDTLAAGRFRHLAIANPALAPYGAAARDVLEALGVWQEVRPRLVRGESIGQAFQLVATGNAELGFVALAQLARPEAASGGSRWDVPAELHAPIRQDAILLSRAVGNPAAEAFLTHLRSATAQALIERFGYGASTG